MREIEQKLLRRVYRRRLSRNKHFYAFLDPKVRRAARVGRHLRSIKADLLRRDFDDLSIGHEPGVNGDGRVIIELTWHDSRRTSYLSEAELELLREDKQIDRILRGAEVEGCANPGG
jgi:hypothetical protein